MEFCVCVGIVWAARTDRIHPVLEVLDLVGEAFTKSGGMILEKVAVLGLRIRLANLLLGLEIPQDGIHLLKIILADTLLGTRCFGLNGQRPIQQRPDYTFFARTPLNSSSTTASTCSSGTCSTHSSLLLSMQGLPPIK